MKNKFILLTVMFGLLLAGCASQESPAPSAPSDTASESGTNGAGSADTETSDSSADTSTDTSGDSSSGASEPEDSGTSGAGDDFSGLDYEGVMALGLPGVCDITTQSEGKTYVTKAYFNGAGDVRYEMDHDEPNIECSKYVMITDSSKVYFGCLGAELMPGCDWLEMAASGDSSTVGGEMDFGTGGGFSTDYSDVPAASISCVPWIPDSTKFQTPGKVCSLEDLMQGYTP
jgi:hypothetical protein